MKRVLSIRKGVLALLLALSLGMGTAYAYNFSAICSTGQTLYYNITDATNHYVEITCPGSSSWSGYTQPTGNIELPSYVTHNGVTYTVTAIGYKAFFNCSGLTGSLTIPNTVTSIGHLAFQGCSGFHGSLTFGTGVTSIGMSAFYGCTHFSGSLTIPDSVTEIQNSTFWSCSGFTGSLIIPNSVTSIGATAFQDCTGFTGSLTLGTGVTSIDNGAFYRCTGFTSIKAFPETPPTLGTTVFYNVPTTIPVFVPCGLLQAYQNAPGWSSFSNLVESCPQQLTVNNGPEDNNYIPVFGWFCDHYSKSQFIIPASDLQTMQQSIITKLTFYALNTNVSWGDARFDVYLAEVEETSFGSTTLDWTGMTKVLENASLSVANNKMEVVLSLPYLYQGGNLKVGIKQVVSGNNVTCKWYGVSKNSTVAIGGYEETRGLGFYQFLPKTTFDYFSAPQTSIEFADPQVKNICVANWDTNHDGELSYDEAAAVTELGTVFGETSITSFDELQYFTGLSYILDEAFFSCEQLTSVIIPSGVGTIYNNAFTGCSSLTSIIIPSSVHNIHDNPFMSCPALANIVVEAGNTVYDSRDNCNAIIVTATNTLKTGCINTVIPNNIEAIGIGAFWGCTGLTSIAIPNSVTIIGGGAFRFCSSLELFVFPNSVTYIGNVVFEDCTSLTSLTVPAATPPSLETNTFYGISTGIPVYVPCGSLAAYQAAAGWSNFTNIQCDLGNIVFVDPAVKAICVDNWDANGDGELSYAEAAAVTSLIPEGETNSAFYQNTSITSFNELQYFTGLEVINNEAFYNCRNLTQVTFPNSVISIMHRAFSGCHNLTSVTIPNSVIFIGQTAFGSCNLTSIVIPSSVTAIDDNPFSACSSLAQISVDEGNQEYSSPNNCNAIIETGTNTLVAGCKNTVIPEGVTTIAWAAFNYCNDLTGINIPSSVTRIGESAFRHCTGLTTLTIPSAVNYIGVNAFLYCTGLTEITVLAPTPPELDGYVFSTDMLNIPVYVPCESLAAYQTYDNGQPWGGFTNIQCMVHDDFPYVDDFTTASGWQLFNGDLTNQWVWGEAGNRGDPHIYISDNNGISNHYTNTSLAMVYAAKLFRFEEGWYRFQYDWLAYGESNYDYLRVALVPASVTLSAGTAVPTGFSYSSLPSGWIALDGGQQLNMNAWWQTTFSEINVPAGDYMMVFAWHNDDSDGYQPPAAIDNVSIRPVSCLAPVGLTAQHVGRTQVTLDWTPVGNENEWEVWLSWPNGNETWSMPYTATTHPFTISGLGAGVTYTATVNAKCGPDNTSYASNEISFTTSTDPCDNPATFPFSENFDGYAGSTSASVNILPDCWSRINTTTVSSQQGCPTILQASYAQSAPNFLYFLSSYVIGSYEDPQDQYAILPPMDHIDHMELSLYASSNTTFMVGVMTDPTDAGTFTELATCQPSPYTYTQYSIPLDNYTGDGWYIAIKMPAASSDMNERALFIDDVSVNYDPLIYSINPDGVSVTVTGHMDGTNATGQLIIPETKTIDGVTYTVTAIGDDAFNNCEGLTGSLTIPNTVTTIGNWAFGGCTNLSGSLILGNSLTTIGNFAFNNCEGLTGSLTIPNTVTTIGNWAFSWCKSLSGSLILGNSLTEIGDHAFNNCNSLTGSLTIPNSVTAIGDDAFVGCGSLTGSLTLGNSLTSIGISVFGNCGFTGSLTIPNSVNSIGANAFSGCSGFTSLSLGNSVTEIGSWAFAACTHLTTVTVQATTPPTLGEVAFLSVSNTIPVYVPCGSLAAYQTYDNGQPWGGFTNIQCIVCSAELPLSENFDSYPGVTSGSENVLPDCWSRINTTTVSSQQGYPTIFQGSYAQSATNFLYFMSTYAVGYFEDPQDQYAILPSIDNVSDLVLSLYARIPAEGRNATFMVGVMTDPEDASTFTELATYQPSSYTYTQYTIPFNNYTGNGQYIAIKMPAASSSVNYRGLAIDDLTLDIVSSPNIVFADANVKAICVDNWDTNGDGELSYDEAAAVMTLKPSGAENSVFWNTEITSFDELQYFTGLTSIEENAFMFCNSLTSVTLPNAVTSIGSYAFAYCISLTSVSLPNSLTTIGDFAFTNATSLSTIELPLSLMDIGMMAFDNCGLVSVVIPASVMGIGINPFTYCSSLTSITVDGPSNVFYTPNDNALVNSQTQTLVTGLSTTIIPNTVTTIGAFAFDGCINLTSITIPNSVTYIDNLAFHYCIGLTSITVEATTPPTLGNDVFQAIPVDIPVYVPCESLDAYQDYNNTGSPWGGFTNIKTLNEHFPWTEDFENYAGLNNNNTNYNTMPSCWSSIHGANPAQNYYDRYPSVYTYSNYAHSGSNFIFFADNYNTDYTHSDQYAILPPVENVNQMTLSLYALKEYRTAYFEVGVMTDPDDASTFTMVGSATATTTHTLYSFSFANYTGTGTYIAIRMPKATNGNNRGVCIDDVTLDHVITFADPAVKAICVQNWDTNGDGELSYIEAAAVTSLGQVFQNAFQEEGTNVTFNELQYFTGLTSIGANAFAGCWRLTSVTLPPTVTTIGSNAFTMCSGLASSPITNHVTEIGDYAFNYCYSLTEIELPSSVTSIGNRAFDRCYYLTSVVIPASVTSIGINPFSGCTRLASIVVDEGNTVYGSPNGCNAIINTEEHLLVSGCNNTNIPDGVQTIGWYAFLASGLTTLTIPTSVNSIADYAFSECEALSELTLLATTPPTLEGTDVFSYINLDIPVYVPCESLEAYQTYNNGQPWGGFTNIRCDVCTAELPLSENFDSYQGTTSGATNVLPDCWDRINTAVDIAYTGYPTILNEPANAYSGSNYLRFHYNQGYGSEQYVILPYVDDIAEVSLWFYAKALTENAAIFVGVMTDPNDVSTFETAFEIDNLTSDYQQCNVSIDPEYINDQTHYIAIKSGANYGATQCDLCIDNLELLRMTQQNLTLSEGWNWWTPTVRTYRSVLQYALGSNGIIINTQNQGFQKYNGNYWSGTLPGVLEPGQMYKIKTNAAVSTTLQGLEVNQPTITIVAGYNWFGYTGTQAADIATALGSLGVSPTDGDIITDKDGHTATYNGNYWNGTLTTLQPGHGYVYRRQ